MSKKIFKLVVLFVVVGFLSGLAYVYVMPEKPELLGSLVHEGSSQLGGYQALLFREAADKYQYDLRRAQERFSFLEDMMWTSFGVVIALSIAGSIALAREAGEKRQRKVF